jgi:hypothetical protein
MVSLPQPMHSAVNPIQVITSLCRSCIFGPDLSRDIINIRRYTWKSLTNTFGSEIVGIFYDALSVSSLGRIGSIGITQDDRTSTLALEGLPRIPVTHSRPILKGNPMCLFISIGNFAHVQKLEVRRVQSRCTGLCIHQRQY